MRAYRYPHIFAAMMEGYVLAGWLDRYVDDRTSRLRLDMTERMGVRVLTPRIVGYPKPTVLLEPVFLHLVDPIRLPTYPEGREVGYAFFPVDQAVAWTSEPGLEVSVRIQGHMGVMRRKGGRTVPPSIMARIIDRDGDDYESHVEWISLPLSLPLLYAYMRVLEKLGDEGDWNWFCAEVLERLKLGYGEYHRRLVAYLEAKERGASAKARSKILRPRPHEILQSSLWALGEEMSEGESLYLA